MINITPKKVIESSPNNDEVVLSVEGVSKKFCRDLKRSLFYGVQDIASELTGIRKSDRLRTKEFWALDNVSFQLKKGEALGLVGKNGSGKSTLLRIIAGLIKPDRGTVKVTGRVAPLIALGAGFNPILTGRENIYANMSILGLSTKEIEERFDDVVEFAEIGEAIDAPVQTYSSGMAARLGFASAIHTEPDILLIDEVLAVGDSKFQSKCLRRLESLRNQSVTFIIVSHNTEVIYAASDKAAYLKKGSLVTVGNIYHVMGCYEDDLSSTNQIQSSFNKPYTNPPKTEVSISSIFFRDRENNKISTPISGQPIYICIETYALKAINNICLRVRIQKSGHVGDFLFMNNLHDGYPLGVSPGKNELKIYLPYLGLMPGQYSIIVIILKGQLFQFDVSEPLRFKVTRDENQTNIKRSQYNQIRNWNQA